MSKIKIKIFVFGIIMLLVLGNVVVLVAVSEGNQSTWPTSWTLTGTDPDESESNNDYKDVRYASYYYDDVYLYFRLECFASPNFTIEHESRYKWFIDTNDPHNMAWSGGNVYEAEFLLFVEDSPKPGGNGIGDIYLLHDVDGDGVISDDWPDYLNTPGPILNTSITGYRIIDHCIDIYVRQAEIGNPIYSYFTWSTDKEDSNLDSTSTTDRSDNYWNENLSKADLSIVTSDSTDPASLGAPLTYTLQVTNHGPHDVVNVFIKDTLPDTVTFINAVPAQNGITGQTVWWNFTSLAVDDSKLITINGTIKDNTSPGMITNFAVTYSDTYDPMLGNNIASEDTTVGSDTDGDGVGDNADLDDDNDGWSDAEEILHGTDSLNLSSHPSGSVPPSNPYTPLYDDPAEDDNNTPIVNTSIGEQSLAIGNENNTFNVSYSPLSQPIITGPSEGYIDIVYNFSIIFNDSDIDIKFIINWGDDTINESDYLVEGSVLMMRHKWIQPGQFIITVTAFDGQNNATTSNAIKIDTPDAPGVNIAQPDNVLFILLALLALMFLPLYFLLGKRRKGEEQEDKK